MQQSADYYEKQALEALSAAYTSTVNEDYNLRAAQVYATLTQAAAVDDLRTSGLPIEDVNR